MNSTLKYPWKQADVIVQSKRILSSFKHWTGKRLLEIEVTSEELAEALFMAPFPVASHGTEADPIYNYGNRLALELWQLDWDNFIKMPSRNSAERLEQTERQRLLKETQAKGICNWQGVRISSKGQRFFVRDGLIWNLLDEQNQICGQAATYSQWEFI